MNRLRLKKKALNKKTALIKRVFQTHLRADFLERIVSVIRGFTVFGQNQFKYLILTSFFFQIWLLYYQMQYFGDTLN